MSSNYMCGAWCCNSPALCALDGCIKRGMGHFEEQPDGTVTAVDPQDLAPLPKVKLTVTDPALAADPLVQRWIAMAQVQIEAEFASRHQAEFDRRWTHKELGKIQVIPEMPDTVEPCDAGPWGPCPRPSACTCPPRERP